MCGSRPGLSPFHFSRAKPRQGQRACISTGCGRPYIYMYIGDTRVCLYLYVNRYLHVHLYFDFPFTGDLRSTHLNVHLCLHTHTSKYRGLRRSFAMVPRKCFFS